MPSGCGCQDKDDRFTTTKMGVLERPRYSPGLILEDSDLTAAVNYTRDLNRLLFRSLFGCGVVCGLEVTVKLDCELVVTVNPGLGIDGCGNPIHLVGQVPIRLGKRAGVLVECGSEKPPKHRDFWVVACSREKNCAPRSIVCDSDELDCSSQTTRTRSGVEISVTFESPQCGCSAGLFGMKFKSSETSTLPDLAESIRTAQTDRKSSPDVVEAACPPDCGCDSACSCGCCVLLAWVHWFDKDKSWVPLHNGVRRFVRPLLASDPRWDFEPDKAEHTGGAAGGAGTAGAAGGAGATGEAGGSVPETAAPSPP